MRSCFFMRIEDEPSFCSFGSSGMRRNLMVMDSCKGREQDGWHFTSNHSLKRHR
jgi:hypothetical protein